MIFNRLNRSVIATTALFMTVIVALGVLWSAHRKAQEMTLTVIGGYQGATWLLSQLTSRGVYFKSLIEKFQLGAATSQEVELQRQVYMGQINAIIGQSNLELALSDMSWLHKALEVTKKVSLEKNSPDLEEFLSELDQHIAKSRFIHSNKNIFTDHFHDWAKTHNTFLMAASIICVLLLCVVLTTFYMLRAYKKLGAAEQAKQRSEQRYLDNN